MNGDVEYQLEGGHVSFDTLWRLDQLAATLTGQPGWRITVEVDPGVVLTATPARVLDAAGTLSGTLSGVLHALEQAQYAPAQAHDAPTAPHGGNHA